MVRVSCALAFGFTNVLALIARTSPVVSVCALIVGCVERAPYDPSQGEAVRVVAELERALAADDFRAAIPALDLAYRLEELLGDLWRAGSDTDRQDLVAVTEAIFEDQTRRRWAECCVGRALTPSVWKSEGQDVWVRSDAGGHPQGFRWLYRVTRRGTAWRITQREYRDNNVLRSDTSRFWPLAIKKIGTQFGRPPTLRELAANLPSVVGTIRSRSFKVPDLPNRPARASP